MIRYGLPLLQLLVSSVTEAPYTCHQNTQVIAIALGYQSKVDGKIPLLTTTHITLVSGHREIKLIVRRNLPSG